MYKSRFEDPPTSKEKLLGFIVRTAEELRRHADLNAKRALVHPHSEQLYRDRSISDTATARALDEVWGRVRAALYDHVASEAFDVATILGGSASIETLAVVHWNDANRFLVELWGCHALIVGIGDAGAEMCTKYVLAYRSLSDLDQDALRLYSEQLHSDTFGRRGMPTLDPLVVARAKAAVVRYTHVGQEVQVTINISKEFKDADPDHIVKTMQRDLAPRSTR